MSSDVAEFALLRIRVRVENFKSEVASSYYYCIFISTIGDMTDHDKATPIGQNFLYISSKNAITIASSMDK